MSVVHVRFVYVDAAAAAGDAAARELLLPKRQTAGAAGYDLVAAADVSLDVGTRAAVSTGVAIALPPGHEAQVRPRSGLALKHGVTCLNAPGTIDADYRGEVKVLLINLGQEAVHLKRGDRIAQLIISQVISSRFVLVDKLDDTARGDQGFGSTGR